MGTRPIYFTWPRGQRAPTLAAAELQGDREIVLAAVAQNGGALQYAAAELKGDPPLRKLRSINPQLSAVVLVVELRLHLGYACHERLGCQSLLKSLPLEVIELIGQHLTIGVAVHGLIWRSTSLLSEGVPPKSSEAGATDPTAW